MAQSSNAPTKPTTGRTREQGKIPPKQENPRKENPAPRRTTSRPKKMWLHENLTQIQDLIRVARIGGLPRRCRRPTQPPTEATLIVYAHLFVLVPFQISAKNVFVAYSAPPEHLRGDPRLLLTPSLVQYNLQQCCRGVFYYGTMFNYTHGFHGVYPHRLSTNRAKETNYIS